jgi:5,6,7,8-tetrahydromethanopterin hydro-lyase
MLLIGEGFAGDRPNVAHINLLVGPKSGPIGTAYATAAASPGPGHIPFQAVLKPNLPAKPSTLFIGKSVSQGDAHDLLTWGPAQAGVAAGITQALLDGILPAEAEDEWAAIALVWVDPQADDAEAIYANNKAAILLAAERALKTGWPSRAELADGVATVANPFFAPKNP